MRKSRRLLFRTIGTAIAFALLISADAIAADDPPKVEFAQQPGQIAITIGGQPFAKYYYADPKITRPYFAHVHAPSGAQVTRHHPPVGGQDTMDHPEFHPGIWMAFGDISGNDYWRLKARVEHAGFAEPLQSAAGEGAFAVRNRYLDAADPQKVVCEELCKFKVLARPEGTLLLWDSTFTSDHEFTFGDQEEMGLGIRVATPIRVEKGNGSIPAGNGTMTDAKGRKNGAEIGGNDSDWCDYSGTIDGKPVGMTIFCHGDNFRPSWFHARDYGFVAANAFGRAAFKKGEPSQIVVKPGESLRLRYGILIHAEQPGQVPNLAAAYEDYLKQANEAN
jgi:hypothetical protein